MSHSCASYCLPREIARELTKTGVMGAEEWFVATLNNCTRSVIQCRRLRSTEIICMTNLVPILGYDEPFLSFPRQSGALGYNISLRLRHAREAASQPTRRTACRSVNQTRLGKRVITYTIIEQEHPASNILAQLYEFKQIVRVVVDKAHIKAGFAMS
jgi:hypothetical protein